MAWSARRQHVVFVTLMVLAMSFVISLVLALVNHRLDEQFVGKWIKNWMIAIVVAWPTAAIVLPSVRRIVSKLAK